MSPWNDLGEQIRAMREARGYTEEGLARLCGVKRSTISRIETNTRQPSIKTLQKICTALGRKLHFIDRRSPKTTFIPEKSWIHHSREDAYLQVCMFLRERGGKQVDILQFSGDTVVPVLREIARSCPGAEVRLVLASRKIADSYDEPNFHWIRIQRTIGTCKLIKETYPQFSGDIYFYTVPPSIAGIVVDDWMVSVGL